MTIQPTNSVLIHPAFHAEHCFAMLRGLARYVQFLHIIDREYSHEIHHS